MDKQKDRIAEAYFGAMGDHFAGEVRKRVHWVLDQVRGSQVLDVGCSQGIISIFLGREGKHVIGIDSCSKSIEFATETLQKEEKSVQETVRFIHASFLSAPFEKLQFDTILMTELLEHLADPVSFVRRAAKLVKPDGRVIITVPFGVNDAQDHKRTYYTLRLLNDIHPLLQIREFRFFGKWLGVVCNPWQAASPTDLPVDLQVLLEQENIFEEIERDANYRQQRTMQRVITLEQSLKDRKERIAKLQSEVQTALKLRDAKQSEIVRIHKEASKIQRNVTKDLRSEYNNALQEQKNDWVQERERLLHSIHSLEQRHERELARLEHALAHERQTIQARHDAEREARKNDLERQRTDLHLEFVAFAEKTEQSFRNQITTLKLEANRELEKLQEHYEAQLAAVLKTNNDKEQNLRNQLKELTEKSNIDLQSLRKNHAAQMLTAINEHKITEQTLRDQLVSIREEMTSALQRLQETHETQMKKALDSRKAAENILRSEPQRHQQIEAKFEKEVQHLKDRLAQQISKTEEAVESARKAKAEVTALQKHANITIVDHIDSEIATLQKLDSWQQHSRALEQKLTKALDDLSNMEHRLMALRKSKLGRWQVKYWKWRNTGKSSRGK